MSNKYMKSCSTSVLMYQTKTTRRCLGCKRQEAGRPSAVKLSEITWRPCHDLQEHASGHGNKIIWTRVIRKPLSTSRSWLLWQHLYLGAGLQKPEQWHNRRKGSPWGYLWELKESTFPRLKGTAWEAGVLLSFSTAKQEAGQRVWLAHVRAPSAEEFKGVWAALQDSSPRNDCLGCSQRPALQLRIRRWIPQEDSWALFLPFRQAHSFLAGNTPPVTPSEHRGLRSCMFSPRVFCRKASLEKEDPGQSLLSCSSRVRDSGKAPRLGTSGVGQWPRRCAPVQGAQVWPQVRGTRPHMPQLKGKPERSWVPQLTPCAAK